MEQYRLWLHHREIDQDLHKQKTSYEQELAEIDEDIARIEKTAIQGHNALFAALMQHIKLQEHANHITEVSPEYSSVTQEIANGQTYQAPPPANSEQQSSTVSPALPAWDQFSNLDTQDIYRIEEKIVPVDAKQVLSEATDDLLPTDLNTLFEQEPQKYVQPSLPWWLRNRLQENQKPQQTAPIYQPKAPVAHPRTEPLFARRTRLIPYNEGQEGQRK